MTYWNNDGKYEAAAKGLFKKTVPNKGKARTVHGELLRNASKLYYDWYNNGWANLDVLSESWDNIVFWRKQLYAVGIMTVYEYGDLGERIGAWFRKFYENEEEAPSGWFEDAKNARIPEYLETLMDTVIVYAALKEAEKGK